MRNILKKDFLTQAHAIAGQLGNHIEPNFEAFLGFVYDFPIVVNKKGRVQLSRDSSTQEVRRFLESYMKANFNARARRIEWKDVATMADPAVDEVLQVFGNRDKTHMETIKEYHRSSMAAENKIGDLLEAYLATKLEPNGWFWCSSGIIKGVDFFKGGDPIRLLQVKNRSNSENSSSSKIRETLENAGCPVKIEKWYRIESGTGRTHWEELEGNASQRMANEAGFYDFIRTYRMDKAKPILKLF
jgi:SinI restriction endonuclease